MPRLNLRTKLLGTGLVLLGFTAAISAVSIATISGTIDRGNAIYDDGVVPLRNLGQASSSLARLNRGVLSMLVAGHTITAPEAAAIEQRAADLDVQILSFHGEEGIQTDQETTVLTHYSADFDAYSTALRNVVALSLDGRGS